MLDTENLLLQPDDHVRLRTGSSRIKVTEISSDGKVYGSYVRSFITVKGIPMENFVLLFRKPEKGGSEKLANKINHRLLLISQEKKKRMIDPAEYVLDSNIEEQSMLDDDNHLDDFTVGDTVRLKNGISHLKITRIEYDLITARYVSSLKYEKPLDNSIVEKPYDCFVLIKPENTQKESIMTKAQQQATEIGQSILNDHEKIAKVTVGRVLYENIRNVAKGYIKLSWFQRLFISKANLKLVELTTVYGILKVIQNNYDHYIIDCVSLYITSEIQHSLLSAIPLDIENLLKPITRKG